MFPEETQTKMYTECSSSPGTIVRPNTTVCIGTFLEEFENSIQIYSSKIASFESYSSSFRVLFCITKKSFRANREKKLKT